MSRLVSEYKGARVSFNWCSYARSCSAIHGTAMLIDTHTHLTSAEFSSDCGAVLSRAKAAGVSHIVVVSEDLADAQNVLSLCRSAPSESPALLPAVGIHPACPRAIGDAHQLGSVLTLAREQASFIAGIGEIGLDFSPRVLGEYVESGVAQTTDEAKSIQRAAFTAQLEAAADLQLPVFVHSRSAGHHAVECIRPLANRIPGILIHAFDGRPKYVREALALSPTIFFSVAPIVERDAQMQKWLKDVPIDRIVLETDAPALPSIRGARNEPACVGESAKWLASAKGISESEVIGETGRTAARILRINSATVT